MNLNLYKQRLLVKEQELSARVDRRMAGARGPGDGAPQDVADEGATDEAKEEQFAESETDRTVLQQTRDALKRIEDGTFGACAIDGEPIEETRLEAMPWTPYCLKHQQTREDGGPKRPTL